MAIESFTSFVAEQALGIAVGALAVVIAPAIVPKLRTLGQSVSNGTQAAAAKASEVSVAIIPAAVAVAVPVTHTGFTLYEKVSSRVQWYGAQWTRLAAETHAARAPAVTVGALRPAGILAGLPRARVVSSVPGRARLRVNRLKGRSDLAAQTAEALVTVPGIRHVHISSHTGSILLVFDKRRYRSLDALLRAIVAW